MKKYCNDSETRSLLWRAFQKLVGNGHLVLWDSLDEIKRRKIEDASICYYIPWDVQFKDSISTPCRPVFDTSSSTAHGTSLNNILAKGEPDLVKLLGILLGFLMGLEASHNSIRL